MTLKRFRNLSITCMCMDGTQFMNGTLRPGEVSFHLSSLCDYLQSTIKERNYFRRLLQVTLLRGSQWLNRHNAKARA